MVHRNLFRKLFTSSNTIFVIKVKENVIQDDFNIIITRTGVIFSIITRLACISEFIFISSLCTMCHGECFMFYLYYMCFLKILSFLSDFFAYRILSQPIQYFLSTQHNILISLVLVVLHTKNRFLTLFGSYF